MNRQSLQVARTAYPNQSVDAALEAQESQQLLVHSIEATNGSASANNLAIVHSMPNGLVVKRDLGGTVSDISASLATGTATTLIGTTNNDEFTVGSPEKFGLIALTVSQAATGSPVYTYEYWNGSGWTALTLVEMPVLSVTGKKAFFFHPPLDWALNSDTIYSVKVTATTAPGTAIQATALKVGKVLAYSEGVLSRATLQVRFETRQLLLQQGEEIMGFFAYAATANTMEASYQISP